MATPRFYFVDVSDNNLSTWDVSGKFVPQDDTIYQEKVDAYAEICKLLPKDGACTAAARLDDGLFQSKNTNKGLHAEENLIMEYRAKLPVKDQTDRVDLCVLSMMISLEPCHAKYYRKPDGNQDCIELFGRHGSKITLNGVSVQGQFVPAKLRTYVFFLQPQLTPEDFVKKRKGQDFDKRDDWKRAKSNDVDSYQTALQSRLAVPAGTELFKLGKDNAGKAPIVADGKATMPKPEKKRNDKVYIKPGPNL